jgi:hypothetical protein
MQSSMASNSTPRLHPHSQEAVVTVIFIALLPIPSAPAVIYTMQYVAFFLCGLHAARHGWLMPVALVVRHVSGAGAHCVLHYKRTLSAGRRCGRDTALPGNAFAGGLETLSTRMAVISF